MRLLDFRHNKVCLHSFAHPEVPRYAILSHTWGEDEDEVTFKDVTEGSGKGRRGYKKIEFCANQARVDNLDFFWVDTCSINKENSSELIEAITSMFRWYQNADRCYVYLSDVSAVGPNVRAMEQALRESRWFTRGWTLQELIAPKTVQFFSSEGNFLGDKRSLEGLIHDITKIPLAALRCQDLSQFTDDEKFRWASSRQTKREEDMAYSLMGIFGVSFVMNYGEGLPMARQRLFEEIKKRKFRPADFPDIRVEPHEIEKIFKNAWNKFTRLLTAEERADFHETRIEDVRRAVFNMQREQERKKSLMGCSRLNNLLKGMNTIVKLSGQLFSMDNYAAYILGPIKFMLYKASHYAETFDALLSAYEVIGEKLTFLSSFEKDFDQYPLAQHIIGWVYTDLLEFHIKAQRFFRRRGWKQVFKADWAEFETRFQGILVNLQRQKDLAELLARYTGAPSSGDIHSIFMEKLNTYALERDRSYIELNSKEKEEKEKKYWRVMEWLACLRPAEGEDKIAQEQVADHESFCEVRKRHPGSGDWMMQNGLMASWMDDEIPIYPVLWLNGIPGAGKTILASRVIEECERKKGFKTSYFYCKESSPQRKDALSILRGLLVQIVTQERTMVPYFFMKAKSSGQVTLASHQLAQNLIKISCLRILNQFIIIDGLDECPKEERRILLSFLAEVVDETEDDEPGKLRVLIVSQEEADIAETLSKESRARPNFSVGQLAMRQSDNKKEIESFVDMWTDQIRRKFGLIFDEVECIKRLMSSRTNGMFLYAKLVLENLFNQTNKHDVVTELDENCFPDGIAAAYAKILGRLERQWKDTRRVWNQIIHLLGWMICAKRPLKHYEIQCAFCLELTEDNERLHDIESRGLIAKVTELCGTLVHELPGERLELVHNTARLYLAKTPYISKPDVECKLASLCLRYLTLDFFDPDLEEKETNQYIMDGWLSLQDYAVSKWFQHIGALAETYKEEGLDVEDSLAALYSSTSGFLDRYADNISDKPVHDDVRDDYAHLSSQRVYEDITRIMSHVTRHMEKGPGSRNEISIQSLRKAFERNRELIEKLSAESSRKSAVRGALVRYYGHKHFKCPFVTCLDFYEGFNSAKMRDKHVNKHNRPWVCEVPHCTSVNFGFTSNRELEKHMRDYHPDKSDLSELFKLTPKKVIESKHVCHICGKNFSRNFHKMNHIRSHNGERPFVCTECGKAFTRNNDRKRHEKIHSRQ